MSEGVAIASSNPPVLALDRTKVDRAETRTPSLDFEASCLIMTRIGAEHPDSHRRDNEDYLSLEQVCFWTNCKWAERAEPGGTWATSCKLVLAGALWPPAAARLVLAAFPGFSRTFPSCCCPRGKKISFLWLVNTSHYHGVDH